MATPRGAEHRDLEQQFRNLQAQVDRLTSAVLGQRKLSVSSGDFAVSGGGSVDVSDGGGITVHDGGNVTVDRGGDLRILDDSGNVVWSALAGPIKAEGGQWDADNLTVPTSTTTYGALNFTVPDGFTRAFVTCFASVGSTFTAAGYLIVSPKVDAVSGPSIANGTDAGISLSVSSYMATELVGLSAGDTVALRAVTDRNGSVTAGSGNVHISGSALFLR